MCYLEADEVAEILKQPNRSKPLGQRDHGGNYGDRQRVQQPKPPDVDERRRFASKQVTAQLPGKIVHGAALPEFGQAHQKKPKGITGG
jgi:hypothetical protein